MCPRPPSMSTAHLAFAFWKHTTPFGWMNLEEASQNENTFGTSASWMISCVAEVPASEAVCILDEENFLSLLMTIRSALLEGSETLYREVAESGYKQVN